MSYKILFAFTLSVLFFAKNTSAQVDQISPKQAEAAALLRCYADFSACPERKAYMIKMANYTECIGKLLNPASGASNCDQYKPLTSNPPNCPEDAARVEEANTFMNACIKSKGFNTPYHATANSSGSSSDNSGGQTPGSAVSEKFNLGLSTDQQEQFNNLSPGLQAAGVGLFSLAEAMAKKREKKAAAIAQKQEEIAKQKQADDVKRQADEAKRLENEKQLAIQREADFKVRVEFERQRIEAARIQLQRQKEKQLAFESSVKNALAVAKPLQSPSDALDQSIKEIYYFAYAVQDSVVWVSHQPLVSSRLNDQSWPFAVDLISQVKQFIKDKFNITLTNLTLSGYYDTSSGAETNRFNFYNRVVEGGNVQVKPFAYSKTKTDLTKDDFWDDKKPSTQSETKSKLTKSSFWNN